MGKNVVKNSSRRRWRGVCFVMSPGWSSWSFQTPYRYICYLSRAWQEESGISCDGEGSIPPAG